MSMASLALEMSSRRKISCSVSLMSTESKHKHECIAHNTPLRQTLNTTPLRVRDAYLVGVEGVDDEGEQLVDLGLEGKSLGVGHCCCLSGRSRVYQGKREQPSYRRYEVMWGVVVYIYTPT